MLLWSRKQPKHAPKLPLSHTSKRSQRSPNRRQRNQRTPYHGDLALHIKTIKTNPVKLAPTSPYNLVTEAQTASISSRSAWDTFAFQLQGKVAAFNAFHCVVPSFRTVMPGATNFGSSFSRLRVTMAAGFVETASMA